MTVDTMFSPSWYRVAPLQPRLRSHVEIHRHHYRGKLWYVLQDHSTGRYHRFSPTAYYIIAQMDGEKTFQEIWDMAVDHLGDDAPTQDEMIRLASQLHASDTLVCDVPPDTLELFQRSEMHEKVKWKQRLWSPLSIRFNLFDPEKFLTRTLPYIKPLFSWLGMILWLFLVGYATFLAGVHWDELSKNMADRVLSPENLLILWLVYPVVKLIHEFGHAYATKAWGGEVHEMGLMFLVFIPVPFVEASSSSAFREKRKRMIVDAAGVMVELLLSAFALFVWINVEHGITHAIAYNVILIGSVSTLMFNGNPLLRFDGYYFFLDLIEIPNLGSRSTNYLGYLVQRYLFGAEHLQSPASTAGERFWFVLYGISSFFYRLFISGVIAMFVAGKFFIIGVLLACWALTTMLIVPLVKKINFLIRSPVITGHRVRALSISLVFVAVLSWFVFMVPFPYATRAEGIIWPQEESLVRVKANGFCKEVLVPSRKWVKRGEPILINEDPLLVAEKNVLIKKLKELEARYFSLRFKDRAQAALKKEEMAAVRAQLQRFKEMEKNLVVRSPLDGVLILPKGSDMDGKFFHQGELVGYVVQFPLNTIRVVVPQDSIGLVRDQTQKVNVRLAERIETAFPAKLLREVPAATEKLPSVALGLVGGGEVAVDPSDKEGVKTFESVFQLDLVLPDSAQMHNIGERAYIRFDHGKVPLGEQWYRILRQLFLRKFSV